MQIHFSDCACPQILVLATSASRALAVCGWQSLQNQDLKYSALPTSYTRSGRQDGKVDPCHMRDKTAGELTW